jgi:CHASE1-domain containing sensor protein
LAAFFGFVTVSGLAADLALKLACVMVFAATIGTANSLIWSLLPAAAPSQDAAGATAGLVTQGSFVGVLISPPTFFWIRHESPALVAALGLMLAALMMVALYAQTQTARGQVALAGRH